MSGKISVRWDAPANVSAVEVFRKKGPHPPESPEDGQKITVKANRSFEDGDCGPAGNGYLFVCVYKSASGVRRSKGVTRTFLAFETLKPLADVKLRQNGTTSFTLSSALPASGGRKIFYGETPLIGAVGATLQTPEFKNVNRKPGEAPFLDSGEAEAMFTLPPDKIYYVYPAVYNEQLLILSEPVVVNTMIGIFGLSAAERDGEAVVTGQLHPKARAVTVRIGTAGFIEEGGASTDSVTVTREAFEKDKGIRVRLRPNADNYITAFTETESGELSAPTFGVKLNRVISLKEKVSVRYAVRYKSSPVKSFKVTVKFEADAPAALSGLELFCGIPKPLGKDEGKFAARVPACALKKGSGGKYRAKFTLKSPPGPVNIRFALFGTGDDKGVALKEVTTL